MLQANAKWAWVIGNATCGCVRANEPGCAILKSKRLQNKVRGPLLHRDASFSLFVRHNFNRDCLRERRSLRAATRQYRCFESLPERAGGDAARRHGLRTREF